MNSIKQAFRNLPRRGQHNFVKILCLALGLAVGSVLIAELYFEQTYDTFFPASDRTYVVNETIVRDGEYKEYPQTSGAIAHGLKAAAPMVEAATRYTIVNQGVQVEVGRKKGLSADVVLADSCFFDVLPRGIVQGDVRQALARPFYCMVSRSFAEKAGGDVVGKRLTGTDLFGGSLTIGGVYEDFPLNSSVNGIDVVVSLNTIHAYPDFDGSGMWLGNDRYITYIRLAPGKDISSLQPYVKKMMDGRREYAEAKKAGVDCGYSFTQVTRAYTDNPYVKTMFWVLSILAVAILAASLMNYLLIVVGNIVARSKEMAVRKCYGAGPSALRSVAMAEAFVHLLLAVVLAALIVVACKGAIEQFISAPLEVLLFNRGAWILAAICAVLLLVGGLVPAWLYSRVPVASAFRGYSESRSRWKLALLSVQFAASGLMFSLLIVINAQYNRLVADNPGYEYSNLAVLSVDGIGPDDRAEIINTLSQNPDIEAISTADCLPLNSQSGNNVMLPGDDRELFNAADLYGVGDGYFDLMGIKIVEGRGFTEKADSLPEIVVSQSFVNKLRTTTHFKGSAIGKKVYITGHDGLNGGVMTIVGVHKDVRIGSASQPDQRPDVMFYSKAAMPNILLRFRNLTSDNMQRVREKVENDYPDRTVGLESYSCMMKNLYISQRSIRTGVMVTGFVTLAIALLGLVGYTIDEVNRRSKEIAIRKVNGARAADILRLFLRGTMLVAVPSVVVGCAASYFVAAKWLSSFAERIPLTAVPFVAAAVFVLLVAAVAVVANCLKVSRSNPIGYLKDE